MTRRLPLLLALFLAVLWGTACTREVPATPTLSPTATPSPQPTATATPKPATPTRTPRPTPTLPPGNPIVKCIPPDAPRMEARVLRVVDGDTIVVFAQGQTYTVRYLGIDTPEIRKGRKPAHPWGPPAHRRNRELVGGKRVLLVADPIADDRDRYGRLLRYVLVGDVFVDLQLVEEGLAWLYPARHSCEDLFKEAEARAKAAGLGVWSGATPTPIPRP